MIGGIEVGSDVPGLKVGEYVVPGAEDASSGGLDFEADERERPGAAACRSLLGGLARVRGGVLAMSSSRAQAATARSASARGRLTRTRVGCGNRATPICASTDASARYRSCSGVTQTCCPAAGERVEQNRRA